MKPIHNIILMVVSMFCFSTSDAFIRGAGSHLNSGQILFFLGLFGTTIFASICLYNNQAPFSRSYFHPRIIIRNIGEAVGTLGIITGIVMSTISTITAIQQFLPLLVTMGAALFLNERVGWRRWTAIFMGFLCVMLIIRPGLDSFNASAIWGLVGVIGLSVRDLATKNIDPTISSFQLSTYGYSAFIPAGLVFMAFFGEFSMPDATGFAFLGGLLFWSMLAYVTMTASMRTGEISAIIPFRYSRLIFGLFYGIVLFGERPDWQTLLGAFGLLLSGLFLLSRNKST